MRRLFPFLLVLTVVMFAGAPFVIADALNESTMGMVYKIFYFHLPTWFAMSVGRLHLRHRQRPVFVQGRSPGRSRGRVGRRTGGRIRRLRSGHRTVVGAKSLGGVVAWEPRLTMALLLELIFLGYLLLRTYGGPGAEKLAAAIGIFGMANVPFIYVSVEHVADAASQDVGRPLARARHAGCVLVLRGGVHAAVCAAADAARRAAAAAGHARRLVSGRRRRSGLTPSAGNPMLKRWLTLCCSILLLGAIVVAQAPAAQDGFVPANSLPPATNCRRRRS